MKHLYNLSIVAVSCSNEPEQPEKNTNNGKLRMEFSFSHPDATKATESSFEKNDAVGFFMTESDKILEIAGNVINNCKLQFDGSVWTSSKQLYWNPGTYNVFAYYPFIDDVNSITDLDFEVKSDQRTNQSGINGYEMSDFLYANNNGITASSNPISLKFKHIMSKLTVRLIKGEDYEGEIPQNGTLYIHNTVPKSTIDLQIGIATKNNHSSSKTITARQVTPTSYSAIIVPQRIDNRVPFIEVILNGVSFLYESRFNFKPGVHHIVNLVVNNNPEQIKIEIGGEITNWN